MSDDIYKRLRAPEEPAPAPVPVEEGPSPFQKLVLRVSERFINLNVEVKDVIDKNFRDIVKAGLGIDTSWGRNEFNHTNGFRSRLDELVRSLAQVYIANDALEVLKDILANDKKFKADMKKEFLDGFRETYRHALQEELKSLVQAKRNEVTESLVQEAKDFVKNIDKTIGPALQAEIRLAQRQLALDIEGGKRETNGI